MNGNHHKRTPSEALLKTASVVFFTLAGICFLVVIVGFCTSIPVGLFFLLIDLFLFYLGILYRKNAKTETSTKTENNAHHTTEIYTVVGIHYYEENIKKLATKNPDWSKSPVTLIEEEKIAKKIFQYYFKNKPVLLIPEPQNKHDKNAIMVQIAGQKVGYISRDDNLHVHDILFSHEVEYISSYIGGGAYKVVSANGDVEMMENYLSIRVKICYK